MLKIRRVEKFRKEIKKRRFMDIEEKVEREEEEKDFMKEY